MGRQKRVAPRAFGISTFVRLMNELNDARVHRDATREEATRMNMISIKTIKIRGSEMGLYFRDGEFRGCHQELRVFGFDPAS